MPNAYQNMTDAQLDAAIAELERQADDLRALNLKLDMARGKPSPEQTALSKPMLDLLTADSDLTPTTTARPTACPPRAPLPPSSSAWTRPTSPSWGPRA